MPEVLFVVVCLFWQSQESCRTVSKILVSGVMSMLYIVGICRVIKRVGENEEAAIFPHIYTYILPYIPLHIQKRHFEALEFADVDVAVAVAISAHQWTNDSGDILEHITLVKSVRAVWQR